MITGAVRKSQHQYLLLISMFLSHSCPKVIILSRIRSVSRPDDGPAPRDDHNAALNVSEDQGPVSERRLSENSEYVNPEMRETLGFPFQKGRFVKPGKAG